MILRTGLQADLGASLETTYGVPVTPAVFWPMRADETLEQKIDMIDSASVISGRLTRDPSQRALGRISCGGDTNFDFFNRSFGKLFKAMFGGVNTTGSDPYTHTFTPADLTGISMTLQKGVPGIGGTVDPKTYLGAKAASWQIACKEGELASLGITWLARLEVGVRTVADGATTNGSPTVTSATAAFGPKDVGTPISGTGIPANSTIIAVGSATSVTISANATATGSSVSLTIGVPLASPSYASSLRPFHYDQGVLTIGGTAVKIKDAMLSGDNQLVDDRRFLGQRYIDEPLQGKDLAAYSGTATAEFTDATLYNRFLDGVQATLVLSFTAGTDSLSITHNAWFTGGTPKINTKGVIEQPLAWDSIATTDAGTITAVLVDHDATV